MRWINTVQPRYMLKPNPSGAKPDDSSDITSTETGLRKTKTLSHSALGFCVSHVVALRAKE
jgi:hypothetical protein